MATVSDLVGHTISHYRILRMIGSGGMGVVYEAEDLKLGRNVALKFLPEELAGDTHALERLRREARTASVLHHPNICTIYEIDEERGRLFIAMELLEGQTLQQKMRGKALDIETVLDVGIQVADGLDAAHSKGIIHRDLKPANIFIMTRGEAKILDFGLAKHSLKPEGDAAINASTISTDLSSSGTALGTIAYMSPEQAKGKELDSRSDLFSFGSVLYEMGTGMLPFRGATPALILKAILDGRITPAVRLNPDLPHGLEAVINKALETNENLRYQHASDIRSDLARLKRDTDSRVVATARVASSDIDVSSWRRRKPALVTAAIVLAALLTLTAWVAFFRVRHETVDSIAVLPFVNATADPDMEYLCDGITDSVINNLSQLAHLRVLARNTAFRYKGKEADPKRIGKDLGVRAVLTGKLLQRGDTLVLQSELMDVAKDSQLWGGQYRRKISDVFALEEDLSREISETLRFRLTREEKRRVTRRHTDNAEAYRLYLKGRYFWYLWSPEKSQKAIEYFQQAISNDPGYALAYAGLADTYISQAWFGEVSPREAMPRAKDAALKALESDDDVAEAHVSLAFADCLYDWDWPSAGKHFERAVALNPSYVNAHNWYSYYLSALGRSDQALAEAKRALDLDPASPGGNQGMGIQLIYARRYDEAIEQFQKALEMDYHDAHLGLGNGYAAKGNYQKALSEFQKYAELDRGTPRSIAALGYAYARLNQPTEALRALNQLSEMEKRRYVSPGSVAIVYIGMGDRDRAFEWLEKSCDEHSFNVAFLKVSPFFDSLRSDQRFTDLLHRVGLSQ